MKKAPLSEAEDVVPLSCEQEKILSWLKKVRFRRAVLGGVSEADVWKKIGELNAMYEAALAAERTRYDALLKDRLNTVARQMAKRMCEQAMARQECDHEKKP
ncbi:MAG: hypothetical protein Q4F17_05255 [Eubacteriales bacterium]|nr:hypothetical protein [Eubacteriales bacterium]